MEKIHQAMILCLYYLRSKSPALQQQFESFCETNKINSWEVTEYVKTCSEKIRSFGVHPDDRDPISA